jgi:hypothetical protein
VKLETQVSQVLREQLDKQVLLVLQVLLACKDHLAIKVQQDSLVLQEKLVQLALLVTQAQ